MTLTILNVIYVLLAIAMIGFILVQRGAGAQAGSGFGGGASATVFGSRGAGNFLTKSTAFLAAAFFVLSLAMGMFISRGAGVVATGEDLGVMGGAVPAVEAPAVPASDVPTIPAPAATAPATDVPAIDVPAPPAVGDAAPAAPTAPAVQENSNESAQQQEEQPPKQ